MQRIMSNLEDNYIKFDDNDITTILDNAGKLWFGGVDCAESIDYKNAKKAIRDHVEDEDKIQLGKINTDTEISKHPHTIFINEAGLYSLIMSSKQEKAKRFKKWVTSEVLPSIREFGYYKFKEKKDKEINHLMKQINLLSKELNDVKNDLREEKFPKGAMFYVVDYSDDEEKYRIGITDDMKQRKKVYDTHMLHKRPVIFHEEIEKPEKLEMCVRSMLYDYRYKNKKDFFICSRETIEKAIKNSKNGLKSMTQNGGANILKQYEDTIKKLKEQVNKCNKEIEIQTIIFNDFKEKLKGEHNKKIV